MVESKNIEIDYKVILNHIEMNYHTKREIFYTFYYFSGDNYSEGDIAHMVEIEDIIYLESILHYFDLSENQNLKNGSIQRKILEEFVEEYSYMYEKIKKISSTMSNERLWKVKLLSKIPLLYKINKQRKSLKKETLKALEDSLSKA